MASPQFPHYLLKIFSASSLYLYEGHVFPFPEILLTRFCSDLHTLGSSLSGEGHISVQWEKDWGVTATGVPGPLSGREHSRPPRNYHIRK